VTVKEGLMSATNVYLTYVDKDGEIYLPTIDSDGRYINRPTEMFNTRRELLRRLL
jgi:hypothetical protein